MKLAIAVKDNQFVISILSDVDAVPEGALCIEGERVATAAATLTAAAVQPDLPLARSVEPIWVESSSVARYCTRVGTPEFYSRIASGRMPRESIGDGRFRYDISQCCRWAVITEDRRFRNLTPSTAYELADARGIPHKVVDGVRLYAIPFGEKRRPGNGFIAEPVQPTAPVAAGAGPMRWVRIGTAARVLRVTRTTVYNRVRAGAMRRKMSSGGQFYLYEVPAS